MARVLFKYLVNELSTGLMEGQDWWQMLLSMDCKGAGDKEPYLNLPALKY